MSGLSPEATGEVFGQEGGGFLVLLTINHADLAEPIRVVNNTQNVTSRSHEFIAYPFKITLPDDSEDRPPAARLEIDNVSREIAQLILSIASPPMVLIEVVRIEDVESVEVALPDFRLRNVEWDVATVSGDLTIDDIAREPFPQRAFTPAQFPGLF